MPSETIAYLSAGHSGETKMAALRELCRTDRSQYVAVWRECIERITYLSCVISAMMLVLTFIMIKIAPEFRSIFAEFGLNLPPATELAIATSNSFVKYLGVPVGLFMLLLFVSAVIVAGCYLCDFAVLRGVADRVFRRRGTADALRILAVAIEQRGSATRRVLSFVARIPVGRRAAKARARGGERDGRRRLAGIDMPCGGL